MELWPENQNGSFNKMGDRCIPFIDWLIAEVQKCISMIRAGTYNDYISKHLSWKHRTGSILRKDEWRVYPERRDILMEGLSDKDLQDFLDYMRMNEGTTNERLPEMTSGLFFKCCALGYAACRYDHTDLQARDQYKKHADGRDDGLLEIDENDPTSFKTWYLDSSRYGGHPWEVCRGGNSTHINLYVHHDDGG